ncbi:MAG: SGNH/GDSL hydrolase family protein [Chloroflexi bacterium]|nr:SGNH/GDSL hydrolase family protein [Chloroflexota bacterium]
MLPFILIFLAVGALLALGVAQRHSRRLRGLAGGLLVSYFTVLLILGAGEIYFRFFYAESENVYTLATKNWLDRYWHTNSLGFRDREWTADDLAGRQTVVVLGDSFAAGWGLQDPADRFSDVLASKLGDGYAVLNLGRYGTATPEQLKILQDESPVKQPDVVILQYFLNDINYAGLQLGVLPEPEPSPNWTKETYLGNFIYWRFLRATNPSDAFFTRWWEWSYAAYDNVGIWSVHKQEIKELVDYVDSIGARLIVVIFPNLLDVVRSIPYIDRVEQAFQEYGQHDILKLFDAAAAWDYNDLMVSRRDSHASASFNHYVGEQLYEQFFAADSAVQASS